VADKAAHEPIPVLDEAVEKDPIPGFDCLAVSRRGDGHPAMLIVAKGVVKRTGPGTRAQEKFGVDPRLPRAAR
jgi:hypothetical protein